MSVAASASYASPSPTNRRATPRRRSSRNSNKTNHDSPSIIMKGPLISPPSCKRRSARGSSSLWELARSIQDGKRVVFLTGAGLSVGSGVRAFRTTNQDKNYSTDSAWKNKNNNKPACSTPSSSSRNKKKKQKTTSSSEKKSGTLVEEQPLGIWNSTLWTQAKREAFRKDPLGWWNDFWLRYFPVEDYEHRFHPNEGHLTIAALQRRFPETIKIITQNVDGLQHSAMDQEERDEETATKLKNNIIEAHGRLGLYKCLPEEDSDTDSSDDEDDDRPVHLGHRRKYRAWKRQHTAIARKKKKQKQSPQETTTGALVSTDVSSEESDTVSGDSSSSSSSSFCEYQMLKSLRVDQLHGPATVRAALKPKRANPRAACDGTEEETSSQRRLKTPPRCPSCGNKVLPQALLFDEGYHSHEHYNFTQMEDWLAAAEVLVFVGTSFAVTLPLVALDHAREHRIPVFNFNVSDLLQPTARLNAENITGPSQETLPKLMQAIDYFQREDAFILGS